MRTHDHIALTHPSDAGGIFFEWFTGELAFDPRFGGAIPARHRESLLQVSRMAWIGAVVDDPLATAEKAARLLDTEVTFTAPDAPDGTPRAGVSLVDNTLALFARPDAERCVELWRVAHLRGRSHALAVEVDDLDAAAASLADRGVGIVRRDDVGIVVDPAATSNVPVVVTGSLLPGDPRR